MQSEYDDGERLAEMIALPGIRPRNRLQKQNLCQCSTDPKLLQATIVNSTRMPKHSSGAFIQRRKKADKYLHSGLWNMSLLVTVKVLPY